MQAEFAAARGALALSEGDPAKALPVLRSAACSWREIDAPHAVATVSVLIGLACRAIGDDDGAQVEFESARSTFARRDARPDLRRVNELLHRAAVGPGGLSARELEVLRLLAAGRTNHAMAIELFVSERTVHRHISNIFDKLGVHCRTAAASYAIQHHIGSSDQAIIRCAGRRSTFSCGLRRPCGPAVPSDNSQAARSLVPQRETRLLGRVHAGTCVTHGTSARQFGARTRQPTHSIARCADMARASPVPKRPVAAWPNCSGGSGVPTVQTPSTHPKYIKSV